MSKSKNAVVPVSKSNDHLGELPDGWVMAKGSDLFEWSSGKNLPKKKQREGDIPVFGGNGIAGYHDEALFDEPTIVVGRVGAHCGNVHSTNGPAWITDNAIYATQVLQEISIKYVRMAMGRLNLRQVAQGNAQPFVNQRTLNEATIPLAPRGEQKRIVSKIEELFSDLDAGVSALERARANLRRYRASVLKSAVEGRLTETWRKANKANPDIEPASELLARILRDRRQRWEQQQLATYESKGKKPPKNWQSKYKEPAAPDTTQIPELVEDGFSSEIWLSIDTVIETLEQGWSPKCERVPSPSHDEWGVIKTSAVMPMEYIEVENKRLPDALEPRPHLEVNQNDLLITRAGPRKRAAVACLVRSTRPRLIVCDKVYRITFSSEFVLPEYMEIVLNAPSIMDVMDEMKTGISDSGVNLTQNRFRELMIPLPFIEEQKAIVEEVSRLFSVVENTDECLSKRIEHSGTLRQSILKSAFEGKLVENREAALV